MALKLFVDNGTEYLIPVAKKKLVFLKQWMKRLGRKTISHTAIVSNGDKVWISSNVQGIDFIRITGGCWGDIFLASVNKKGKFSWWTTRDFSTWCELKKLSSCEFSMLAIGNYAYCIMPYLEKIRIFHKGNFFKDISLTCDLVRRSSLSPGEFSTILICFNYDLDFLDYDKCSGYITNTLTKKNSDHQGQDEDLNNQYHERMISPFSVLALKLTNFGILDIWKKDMENDWINMSNFEMVDLEDLYDLVEFGHLLHKSALITVNNIAFFPFDGKLAIWFVMFIVVQDEIDITKYICYQLYTSVDNGFTWTKEPYFYFYDPLQYHIDDMDEGWEGYIAEIEKLQEIGGIRLLGDVYDFFDSISFNPLMNYTIVKGKDENGETFFLGFIAFKTDDGSGNYTGLADIYEFGKAIPIQTRMRCDSLFANNNKLVVASLEFKELSISNDLGKTFITKQYPNEVKNSGLSYITPSFFVSNMDIFSENTGW